MKNLQLQHQALFILCTGYFQPYLDTLFLPIIIGIDKSIVKFSVLQFCPADIPAYAVNTAAKFSVPLYTETYHNKPALIGTFWDVVRGTIVIRSLVRRGEVTVLHPRSYIPGAMAMLVKMLEPQVQIVFDSDGLMPDERVEFGSWSLNSPIYKLFRFIEKKLMEQSDVVLTRTEQAKKILLERNKSSINPEKFLVIPNGKDTSVFTSIAQNERQEVRQRYGVGENTPLIVYVGSMATQYMPESMFLFFSYLLKLEQKAHFLLLTSGNKENLLALAQQHNIAPESFTIDYVVPDAVPTILASADVGLALRMPSLSQRAVSPIKVCEYLLCGTPVIANFGVGDLDNLFNHHPEIGCLLPDTSNASLETATKWVVDEVMPKREALTQKCRSVGVEYFSLDTVSSKYTEVYRSLKLVSFSQ
ncbi:MAG TPA: glycosyltransferase [Oculatellaceae cyanobacterium]|jgi:glycosyltransferase involved in cell wall biosynthesis